MSYYFMKIVTIAVNLSAAVETVETAHGLGLGEHMQM